MQWLIASLIDLLVQFLEASLRRQNHHKTTQTQEGSDFYGAQHEPTTARANSIDEKIQQAYAFMELTPPVTAEQFNRQYKKLCLRHHPDRNGGSEESKANFQKLRACVEWIEKDMAGVAHEDDDEMVNHAQYEAKRQGQRQRQQHEYDNDSDNEDEEYEDFYTFIRKQQEAKRRYQQMQEEAERAMEQELQRQRKLKKEFRNHLHAERKTCRQATKYRGLQTPKGRASAHEKFQARSRTCHEDGPNDNSNIGRQGEKYD